LPPDVEAVRHAAATDSPCLRRCFTGAAYFKIDICSIGSRCYLLLSRCSAAPPHDFMLAHLIRQRCSVMSPLRFFRPRATRAIRRFAISFAACCPLRHARQADLLIMLCRYRRQQ